MKSEQGSSLLEVMVSISILGLVMAGIMPAFVYHTRFNTQSELRTDAIMAAQFVLDQIRLQDPNTLPTSGSTGPTGVNIGDRLFNVTNYYCEDADYCASANNRHIRVEAAYNNSVIYDVETVFTQLR
ncbi:MAG: type II secretion system protein [Deltaproteobacteria bacterium]|nr:type II secretion system protein [Deltaproteobacteria bacterium]